MGKFSAAADSGAQDDVTLFVSNQPFPSVILFDAHGGN